MEDRSVLETVRTARRICEREGAAELLTSGTEFAISRPRLHPRVHWWLASNYYRHRCANDIEEYRASPDPFKLLWVSPSRIERHTRREYPPYRNRLGRFGSVRTGDWDRRDEPPVDPEYEGPPADLFLADRFEESVLYRSLEAHFERGRPWDETELVRESIRMISEPSPERVWHECETVADVHRRCRFLDELYETIRTEGYRSQRDRFSSEPSIGFRHCLRQEMTVDIGRDGQLLLVSGKHRLAIAKLLDLDRVPVVVLVRHREWMDRRDTAANGDDHKSHPDLCDLHGDGE